MALAAGMLVDEAFIRQITSKGIAMTGTFTARVPTIVKRPVGVVQTERTRTLADVQPSSNICCHTLHFNHVHKSECNTCLTLCGMSISSCATRIGQDVWGLGHNLRHLRHSLGLVLPLDGSYEEGILGERRPLVLS
eukprot:650050-Amphidinium_carterae.1